MYGNEQVDIVTLHLHTSFAQFGSTLSLIHIPDIKHTNKTPSPIYRSFHHTEKPKWVIWLIWAIVGQYTDKMTQKHVKNESFCPCSDPLWLKWVKWLILVFLCMLNEQELFIIWGLFEGANIFKLHILRCNNNRLFISTHWWIKRIG